MALFPSKRKSWLHWQKSGPKKRESYLEGATGWMGVSTVRGATWEKQIQEKV